MPAITPALAKLPTLCFARHPSTGQTLLVIRGEAGYHPVATSCTPEQLNAARPEPPSRAQVAAMLAGSLFGWDKPIADPSYHAPLDAGPAVPAPASTATNDIADWGCRETPFRLEGRIAARPEWSHGPDPLWLHAESHLGFYGWLHEADRRVRAALSCRLLQLPARDWRDAYDGRVPPGEAADVAIDEHVSQHGVDCIPDPDPLPPAA